MDLLKQLIDDVVNHLCNMGLVLYRCQRRCGKAEDCPFWEVFWWAFLWGWRSVVIGIASRRQKRENMRKTIVANVGQSKTNA